MTENFDISAFYAAGRPFAIYRLPGDGELRQADAGCSFLVAPWPGRVADAVDVGTCAPGPDNEPLWTRSTPRQEYIESTSRLVDHLRQTGGKCVRMRTRCATGRRVDINAAVSSLFAHYPDAFCHCYYTPATGLWLGATPELLLEWRNGHVGTMALAGTRRADSPGRWDTKNVREQAYVTDYVTDVLRSKGLEPELEETGTLRYGGIEHICTRIKARVAGDFDPMTLIDRLSPTPAVAGMPIAAAMDEISEIEDAPRRCYAGWVAIRRADCLQAYVNLRCAQLSDSGWCIYAGGGITAESDPEAEWRETEAKSAVLSEILMNNSREK
ncbi:MAG: chorismate-binding protein [Muribaculaceae bacterium]|nr:chorismate-binding protein [Muribaculaceae bacterium]